jgi:hypothetical protein
MESKKQMWNLSSACRAQAEKRDVQKYWPSICQPSNREMHPSLVKANSDEMPIKHLNAELVYLASDVDARITEWLKWLDEHAASGVYSRESRAAFAATAAYIRASTTP